MLFSWPLPGSLQTLRTLAPAFQDRLLNICLTHQLQEVGPRETSMPGSGPLGRQRKRKALSCMCFFCFLQWSGTPAAAESSLLWKGKRFLCFPVNQNLQLLIRGSPNCSLCKNPVICGLVLDHCRESTGGFHPRVSGPTLCYSSQCRTAFDLSGLRICPAEKEWHFVFSVCMLYFSTYPHIGNSGQGIASNGGFFYFCSTPPQNAIINSGVHQDQ